MLRKFWLFTISGMAMLAGLAFFAGSADGAEDDYDDDDIALVSDDDGDQGEFSTVAQDKKKKKAGAKKKKGKAKGKKGKAKGKGKKGKAGAEEVALPSPEPVAFAAIEARFPAFSAMEPRTIIASDRNRRLLY